MLTQYLKDIGHYPLLTYEQTVELGKRKARGDEQARIALINHNLRLPVDAAITWRWGNRSKTTLDIMDVIQDGNRGLICAVNKYDYSRGYHFSTYAFGWIRQDIQRYSTRALYDITVRRSIIQANSKISKACDEYYVEHGQQPSDDWLAERLDLPLDFVQIARYHDIFNISDPEDQHVASAFEIPNTDSRKSLDTERHRDRQRRILANGFNCLSTREQDVLAGRYAISVDGGISGANRRTLRVLAEEHRISGERVRQIKNEAERKLKWWLMSNHSEDLRFYAGRLGFREPECLV